MKGAPRLLAAGRFLRCPVSVNGRTPDHDWGKMWGAVLWFQRHSSVQERTPRA